MGFALRMNRTVASAKAKTVEPHNPYLAARREWDERYGEFITEERQARINPLGLYVTAASWAKVL